LIEEDHIPQARATIYKSHQNISNFKNPNPNPNTYSNSNFNSKTRSDILHSSQQSFISSKNNYINMNNNINFIPCINCNNIINIDDIGK
jgi:hypothetical protein